jgi:hypothetical protein
MKKGSYCPLIRKNCIENKCSWYCQVRGVNSNTGLEVTEWQCAVTLLPVLLLENSNQQRQTSASVQSFRNESVERSDILNAILLQASQGYPRRDSIQSVELKEITPG